MGSRQCLSISFYSVLSCVSRGNPGVSSDVNSLFLFSVYLSFELVVLYLMKYLFLFLLVGGSDVQ